MIRPTYLCAVLEGPPSLVAGFRHVSIVQNGKISQCLSATCGRTLALAMGAQFYPEGTWEAGPAPNDKTMCPIKPELRARLMGEPLDVV